MTTISSRLTAIADDVANIAVTKTAIKDAIATNLGRTVPDGTTFRNFKDHILPPVAWRSDPLWLSLSDIADGQIGMIVRDRDDLGVAARCAFTITATANYVVDWGDGTSQTIASGTMADHTYTLGAGTPDSKGTTTFKVRISSTGTIQRIQMAGNVTGGVVKQTVQSVNIKASGITTMLNAFLYCGLLQNIYALSLPSCASMDSAFRQCVSLQSVGAISLPACLNFTNAFAYCSSLKSIGDLNLPECTTFSSGFTYCNELQSVGALTIPKCSSIANLFNYATSLQSLGDISSFGSSASAVSGDTGFFLVPYSGVINTPNAKYTRMYAYGASDRLSGITGIVFSPLSDFSAGSPQINVSYTMMNRTALVALFNLLPTLVGKTINITGCIGTADLTAGDRAIATGKGWTITG